MTPGEGGDTSRGISADRGVALPALSDDVLVQGWRQGIQRYVVELASSRRAFMLRRPEFTVLMLLNGAATAEEVATRATAALNDEPTISASQVRKLAGQAAGLGLVRSAAGDVTAGSSRGGGSPGRTIDLTALQGPMRLLSAVLFSRLPGAVIAVLVLVALGAEAAAWGAGAIGQLVAFLDWPAVLVTLLFVYLARPFVVATHELGHVFAAYRFTGRVCQIRVQPRRLRAHVVVPPALAWGISDASRRVTLALSGVYCNLVALAAVALVCHLVSASLLRQALAATMVSVAFGIVLSIVPERAWLPGWRSDGYFAASYAIGTPNLEQRARAQRQSGTEDGVRLEFHGDPMSGRQQALLAIYAVAAPVLAWLPIVAHGVGAMLAIVAIPRGGPIVALVLSLWAAAPYLRLLRRPGAGAGGPVSEAPNSTPT